MNQITIRIWPFRHDSPRSNPNRNRILDWIPRSDHVELGDSQKKMWIRMIHRWILWNSGLGGNPGFTNTLGSPVSLDLKYIIAQAQAVSTWAV